LWTTLSIRNGESLTRERGWSVNHHVKRMQDPTRRVLVREPEEA